MLTGNLAFLSDSFYIVGSPGYNTGISYGRAYAYAKDAKSVIPHELVHIYQYREHQVFNTWIKPLSKKIKSKTIKVLFEMYVYTDIPYFVAFYGLLYDKERNHFKNFYEFEAERFATNKLCT